MMPLWKLQTVGRERHDFLYENTGAGSKIGLRPGVAYCFRKFHALISDLVRGAWVRYIRQQNLGVLGENADLNEFLFGSERAALAVIRPALVDIQQGRCFYAGSPYRPRPPTSIISWRGRVTQSISATISSWPTAGAIARSGIACQPMIIWRRGWSRTPGSESRSRTRWQSAAS